MTKQQFDSLPHRFSREEMHQLGLDLARANQEVYTLRSAKKTSASSLEAAIKAAEAHAAEITRKINEGAEFRQIEGQVFMDTPRPGLKTVARKDTGEEVRTEPMTKEDRQTSLNFSEEQTDGKSAAAGAKSDAKPRRSN